MKTLYLTIDDSPTPRMDELTGFLARRGIGAIFYCRGDYLEIREAPAIRAIEQGFVIANHLYSHQRCSDLPYEVCIAEIKRTEKLIDALYRRAGKPRPVRALRFPHMDRGCGGYVVDYEAYPEYRDILEPLFLDGLNITPAPPTDEQREKKQRLLAWLSSEEFTQPFTGVTHDWFVNTEMADAPDSMYTFSTADWMLSPRHLAKDWPFKTMQDLKQKIDKDPALNDPASADIILAHDDREGVIDETCALIAYMHDVKRYHFVSAQ